MQSKGTVPYQIIHREVTALFWDENKAQADTISEESNIKHLLDYEYRC